VVDERLKQLGKVQTFGTKSHVIWDVGDLFLCAYLVTINPLNPKLNPICYLLALLAHHFLHVSRIRVKPLTLRLLMSYMYGAPILDVSRSHNDTPQSVGILWTSDQLVAETST